jgi:hypothetical protein
MSCPKCGSEKTTYVVLEETKEGYVWQEECADPIEGCGWYDTGYEF